MEILLPTLNLQTSSLLFKECEGVMMQIKEIEIICYEVDIDATTSNDLFRVPLTRVKMYKIYMEQLMENLNFEDVMNYYGVTQVCEWCEGNK